MNKSEIKDIGTKVMIEHFDNPEILSEYCTPDFIAHWSWGGQNSLEEVIYWLKKTKEEMIGNTRVVIDDCFADGEKVAIRFRAFFPHQSGGEVMRNEISILRFEGNKCAECWVAFDRGFEEEQKKALDSKLTS